MVSPLDPLLHATLAAFTRERPEAADEDVHMLEVVVDHVIERCSVPGDVVLDPFAGFGTTLRRARQLGREAIGVELLPERAAALRQSLPDVHIIEGDARELLRLIARAAPDTEAGLVLASPPFMTVNDHAADPLTAYEELTGDYARYLSELSFVAAQCAVLVRPGGYVVWNVADITHAGVTTPLIRDCTRALSAHLAHVGTTRIEWDKHPHDLVSDALIVFQRPHKRA